MEGVEGLLRGLKLSEEEKIGIKLDGTKREEGSVGDKGIDNRARWLCTPEAR
jgi:hypothetical protein